MQVGIDSFAAAFDDSSRAVSPSDRLRQLVEQIVHADQVGLERLTTFFRASLVPSATTRRQDQRVASAVREGSSAVACVDGALAGTLCCDDSASRHARRTKRRLCAVDKGIGRVPRVRGRHIGGPGWTTNDRNRPRCRLA